MLVPSKWQEGERIDKIYEKQHKRETQLYMQLEQTKMKLLQNAFA
jgi:hypothetical protein